MPKYMLQASYTAEGTKGLIKDGDLKRREAANALVESMGGTVESMYYALGEDDALIIVDMPDQSSVRCGFVGHRRERARDREDDGALQPRRNGRSNEEDTRLSRSWTVTLGHPSLQR